MTGILRVGRQSDPRSVLLRLDGFDIREILSPSGGPLVLDECRAPQQQVAKILREFVHAGRSGTNLIGVSPRVYPGISHPAKAQHSRVSCWTRDTAASPDTGVDSGSVRPGGARVRVIVRRRCAARSLRSSSPMGLGYHRSNHRVHA